MFASPAYADWVAVSKNEFGTTYYVDIERIRTNGSNVYFWQLTDLLKPDKDGDLSYKDYVQGDCEMFRTKYLSISSYKQPMGEGVPYTTDSLPNSEWKYPPPNSSGEGILKRVCRRAGL